MIVIDGHRNGQVHINDLIVVVFLTCVTFVIELFVIKPEEHLLRCDSIYYFTQGRCGQCH